MAGSPYHNIDAALPSKRYQYVGYRKSDGAAYQIAKRASGGWYAQERDWNSKKTLHTLHGATLRDISIRLEQC